MIDTTETGLPTGLERHLRRTLGVWPPDGALVVATSTARETPGWDGKVVPAVGLATPLGTVLSVPRELVASIPTSSLAAAEAAVARHLGRAADRLQRVVYRWTAPGDPIAEADDGGEWRDPHDPAVPPWLRPFNGGVLVATVGGRHAAGVGIKRHDHDAAEIAVVTDARFRGRGLARRLVAQATREIHRRGAIALYLHAASNDASANLAAGVGFPDVGWRLLDA